MQNGDRMPIKIVGRKTTQTGLSATNNLLKLVIALRGNRPFIPKGIHRFKTFEEAQQWSIKMMARRRKPDLQP